MIRLIHYHSRFSYDLIVAILFVSFHFLTSLTFSSFLSIVLFSTTMGTRPMAEPLR